MIKYKIVKDESNGQIKRVEVSEDGKQTMKLERGKSGNLPEQANWRAIEQAIQARKRKGK